MLVSGVGRLAGNPSGRKAIGSLTSHQSEYNGPFVGVAENSRPTRVSGLRVELQLRAG